MRFPVILMITLLFTIVYFDYVTAVAADEASNDGTTETKKRKEKMNKSLEEDANEANERIKRQAKEMADNYEIESLRIGRMLSGNNSNASVIAPSASVTTAKVIAPNSTGNLSATSPPLSTAQTNATQTTLQSPIRKEKPKQKGERLECANMATKFGSLLKELKKPLQIPLKPLFIILGVMFFFLVASAIWGRTKKRRHRNLQHNWQRVRLPGLVESKRKYEEAYLKFSFGNNCREKESHQWKRWKDNHLKSH